MYQLSTILILIQAKMNTLYRLIPLKYQCEMVSKIKNYYANGHK